MIYRSVNVEMVCGPEVSEGRARLQAANMARVIRAAAYSWLATHETIPGVDFIVDGERVTDPTVLDLQILAAYDPNVNREFAKLVGGARR